MPLYQQSEIAMGTKSITDIKAFLPSKDYELAKQFYQDVGFQMNFTNAEVTEFELEGQNFS